MTGVTTPNLPTANLIDDLIGNAGGNTVRILPERLAAMLQSFQGPSYATLAQLTADRSWPAGTLAAVWNDGAANGVYRKSGNPGAGNWSRIGDLPMSSFGAAAIAQKADTSALVAETAARIAGDAEVLQSIAAGADLSPYYGYSAGGVEFDLRLDDIDRIQRFGNILQSVPNDGSGGSAYDAAPAAGEEPLIYVDPVRAYFGGGGVKQLRLSAPVNLVGKHLLIPIEVPMDYPIGGTATYIMGGRRASVSAARVRPRWPSGRPTLAGPWSPSRPRSRPGGRCWPSG